MSRHSGRILIPVLALAIAWPALAFRAKNDEDRKADPLEAKVFSKPALWLTSQHETDLGAVSSMADESILRAYAAMLDQHGPWTLVFDRVTGQMAMLEGSGIPWIPGTGRGNYVTAASLGLDGSVVAARGVPLPLVEGMARDFIARYPGMFPADPGDLVLAKEASGPILDYLYYVQFEWVHGGVAVEHARLVFRLNHGNLVQIGQEYMSPAIARLDPQPAFDRDRAWALLRSYLGDLGPTAGDQVLDPGRLLIIPTTTAPVQARTVVAAGQGLQYRLVYVLSFRRPGFPATWEARIDAHTGEILSFLDSNRYGRAHGGAYPNDRPADDVDRPYPHIDCDSGAGSVFADAAGRFSGTTCGSVMRGRYTRIVDECGSISHSTSTGDLDFATSGGLDCTTPGFGGAGNTHASRTQYYNVTLIKMKGLSYLPSNTWLNGQLRDNTNLSSGTCNAFWSGLNGTTNFYQSGSSCNNTGELPGISLHEYGHGLDSNDGTAPADEGTGETYGDFTAALQTHSSCVGAGFVGYNSNGYDDACLDCTGVRDIDYGKRASGSPHFAEDLTSNTCTGCTTWACPTDASYNGPCGYEGHCESYISSEPLWDLANRDLPAMGFDLPTAWQMVDRYWYVSRPTAGAAYACPSLTTTDGCGSGSLFSVFRVADDDDGSLANGTPHASAIFAAFNRHKIACSTVNNGNSTACSTIGTNSLFATPSDSQVLLEWSAAANATRYHVYRNEMGCDQGYTRITTVTGTSYTDTLVINGVTYFYRILPAGSTNPCHGSMTNCAEATPLVCTPPSAPTGVGAAANGNYRIDVSWTDVAGETQYDVFRGTIAGGPYIYVGSTGANDTTFSDTTVTGGFTYYYRVRAYNGCYSRPSAEASATALGTCNLPPTFAGVVSVANAKTTSCRLTVSWAAGSSNCGGTLTYSVYRSREASFTPGPASRIASGVTGTSFNDDGVFFKTTYYYAVRAVDSVSALQDGNTAVASNYPTGAETTVYTNTFESDWTGWATGPDTATTGTFVRGDPVGTVDNYGAPCQPENDHTAVGSICLYTAENPTGNAGQDDVDGGEVRLTSPAFDVSSYPSALLDFWRWYENENTDADLGDYSAIEVSNNGGTSWTSLEFLGDTVSTFDGKSGTNAWLNLKYVLENYVGLTNNMRVRFRAADEPTSGDLIEYAIDDFRVLGVASCTGCTPPSVPTNVTATATAANKITVSWDNMGASSYAVYRSDGICPGTMVQIAGNITATSFDDTTVSGGSTYSYVVRSLSAIYCESGASACVSQTATGTCTKPPVFAGVASVTNSNNATCGIALSWVAATASCGGSITYNVHRSTSDGYTPGPSTLIARGVTGTSYSDSAGLEYGVIYYYLVRALESGREESNTVIRSDGPSGAVITGGTLYFNNFETGSGLPADWSAGSFTSANPVDVRGIMSCTSPAPPSGSNIFRWGGSTCTLNYGNGVGSFGTPEPDLFGLEIPFDAASVRLNFQHRWAFQCTGTPCTGDGATFLMKRSIDAPYYILNGSIIIAGAGYNGRTGATTPLGAVDCWNGSQTSYVSTTIDLDAACNLIGGAPCKGETIIMAFTGASNASANDDGWFFDDVRVTANYGGTCSTSGCAMIVDVTPVSAAVSVGQTITFQVQHTAGKEPYSYQWTEGGVDIAGADLPYLAVAKSTPGSFSYNCKVTDASGLCQNVQDSVAAVGTWTSSSPPPVADGATAGGAAATFVKAAGNVTANWDNSTCSGSDSIIVYNTIGTFSGYSGAAVCGAGTDGTETFTPPAGSVWFNVLWVNGTTSGHPGYSSSGARTWSASGLCAMSADDMTRTTCP